MQFSAVIFPYIIRFVLFINPRTIISWLLLNVSRSSDIKNRNKISKSGDPYRILIGVKIVSLL